MKKEHKFWEKPNYKKRKLITFFNIVNNLNYLLFNYKGFKSLNF